MIKKLRKYCKTVLHVGLPLIIGAFLVQAMLVRRPVLPDKVTVRKVILPPMASNISSALSSKITAGTSQRQIHRDNKENMKKKLLLFTQWRSGSSFVGEILKHIPNTFYMFEPLMFFHLEMPSKTGEILLTQNASHFLSAVFDCNVSYIGKVSRQFWPNRDQFRNNWIRNAFNGLRSFKVVDQKCKEKQNMVAKVIKVPRLEFAFPFMTEIGVKTIYLVRDPRGVFLSRSTFLNKKKLKGRKEDALDNLYKQHYQNHMQQDCQKMLLNYKFIEANKNSLKGRLLLVRYEDVAYHPTDMTSLMYSFLGFSRTTALDQWLNRTTSFNPKSHNPFSTQRQSQKVAERWKTELSANLVKMIQKDCQEALLIYNYTLIA